MPRQRKRQTNERTKRPTQRQTETRTGRLSLWERVVMKARTGEVAACSLSTASIVHHRLFTAYAVPGWTAGRNCPPFIFRHWEAINIKWPQKGKGSPYWITERRVPELIPVLGSQPAGDVSHKPGNMLSLLSARPTVILTTLKRAATSFAAR